MIGNFGDAEVFSFHATKFLNTFEGGAIATNDDQRQPDAKDKLREAFAGAPQPVKIEVYQGCQHGWCVSDGMVYNKAEADRAYGELVALYRRALSQS